MYNLSDEINKYINVKEQNKKQEYDFSALLSDGPPKFYPSSVGFCSRRIVMQMIGLDKPIPDPRIIRIMDNGNSVHERYENYFAEMGILVTPELSLKHEELRISGRSDAIIRIPSDETAYELAIIEIKSSNNNQFNRMVKDGKPKDEHYMQLQLYMYLTGIKKGAILVENKDNQDVWEYWCDYDPELAHQIVDKIRRVNAFVDENLKNENKEKLILPEREFEKTSFECRYCDFKEICWKN
jgi:CRISPR/Cas system-associated exonuclease Cas4 (RecB family)